MVLDCKKVFTTGEPLSFSYDFDLSAVDLAGMYPFVSPVHAQGRVQSQSDSVVLHAEVSFLFSIPCDRCAETVERSYSYSFEHPLVCSLNEEGNDAFLEVKDKKLDLDELLRADILLELPTKFLCSPDCRGLCPVCGRNLNTGACSCHLHQTDPRLEVLKKLID